MGMYVLMYILLNSEKAPAVQFFFFFPENPCFRNKKARHKIGSEIPCCIHFSCLPLPGKD